ncbi:SDR family NAD(P)-dependent oxidoreductase [Streptomyces sp. NPDC051546]|uniref:SDR family NAD(P)-dependent oxidoreductase n=1 Tax=Streptomyces sp. NPDC051546 TaxID=3365655 RepID=UPI0037B84FFC
MSATPAIPSISESKVIAVFGAGSGLGSSVARRFGREGFRVALVARRKDRLDALVEELAGEGIQAAAFPADLSRPAEVPALVAAIQSRFGRIDVVEYGPVSTATTPAAELDAAALQGLIPLLLLTPVEVVQAVLPQWTERGEGTFLLSHSYAASQPMPGASGTGPVMAATRNYLYSLNAELAGTGIYAGALSVGALISRSEVASGYLSALPADVDVADIPVVDPDHLAELYWGMYTGRDRVERFQPELPAA